jgi:murein DD-endopeptidase MepM/ murein hydrolase activator NlpD
MRYFLHFLFLLLLSVIGCTENNNMSGEIIRDKDNDDWKFSRYVLPYPVGKIYRVNQGNDSGYGHSGAYKYGYDFDMEIGTIVTAARSGVVSGIRKGYKDGDLQPGHENFVKILHEDGTTAGYSHLSENGVLVNRGDHVVQGDTIGLSGNSGNTGGFRHLHFHVGPCDEPVYNSCGTILVMFKNTEPNPTGLLQDHYYEAFQY